MIDDRDVNVPSMKGFRVLTCPLQDELIDVIVTDIVGNMAYNLLILKNYKLSCV